MKTIEVTISARCSVYTKQLNPGAIKDIVKAFTHRNAQHDKLSRMGYPTRGEPAWICTAWEFQDRGILQVPRGGAKRLRVALTKHGYAVKWIDKRLKFDKRPFPGSTLRLRPNQKPQAYALVKEQQGILLGDTGVGKTETLLGAAIMAGQPTMVIVWNKGLQKQWIIRILKYKLLTKQQIGGLGGLFSGRPRHGLISVVMQQSLLKHIETWKMHYGTAILDEAQRAPAFTFGEVMNLLPAKYRWRLLPTRSGVIGRSS